MISQTFFIDDINISEFLTYIGSVHITTCFYRAFEQNTVGYDILKLLWQDLES